MEKLKNLSLVEKIALGAAICIVFLVLYITLFLSPTLGDIKKLNKELASNAKKWSELQALVQEERSLPVAGAPKERPSLLSWLEESGNQLKISSKIVYLKPTTIPGKGEGAELKLDGITGDELLRFIHMMREAQVNIVSINLRDHGLTGLWTVKMFLEG